MLRSARRANPHLPWRVVWLAVALIALPGLIAMAVILASTATTSSTGGGRPATVTGVASGGSAACATNGRAAVNSTRDGARTELVPPGAIGALLCRYGPQGRRVLQRSVTSGTIASRLARELNALPAATGAYACPFDDGESITADFSYRNGPENPVSVGLSGCQSVTNGHVKRLGLDRPVIRQLERLVPWFGTISGRLALCGGPAPGHCRTGRYAACSGSRCFSADQVGIEHAEGARYPNVRLRRGRFAVRLEPGRYRLVLYGDGPGVHGRVLRTLRVRVRLGRTTRAVFRILAR